MTGSRHAEVARRWATSAQARFAQWPPLVPPLPIAVRALLFEGVTPAPSLAPDDWTTARSEIRGLGLEGTALRLLSAEDRQPPGDLLASLRNDRFNRLLHTKLQTSTAKQVTGLLEQRGITPLVIKGPSVARYYAVPHERTYSDIDVLVRPRQFDEALRILGEAGYSEAAATRMPRPVLRRYGREATNLWTANGRSVDVHHHISPWLWGRRLSFDALKESSIRSSDGWLEVSVVHNLLVVALHLISDRGVPLRNLRCLRDAAVLLQHCQPDAVVREARRAHLGGWLHGVLGLIPSDVPGRDRIVNQLSRDRVPSRWRLHLMLSPGVVRRAGLEQLLRLPLRVWPIFLSSYLSPSKDYRWRRREI